MFGFVFGQTPIIRVKQIGEWKTEYWWKNTRNRIITNIFTNDTFL